MKPPPLHKMAICTESSRPGRQGLRSVVAERMGCPVRCEERVMWILMSALVDPTLTVTLMKVGRRVSRGRDILQTHPQFVALACCRHEFMKLDWNRGPCLV